MGRNVAIIAWVLASAVYAAMMSWTLPTLSTFAGGLPVFDMMPTGYSFAQAVELVNALGEDGRAYYLRVQHKIDTVYPPLLGIAFALSFRLLFKGTVARSLVALAMVAAGLDLLENTAVATMISTGAADLTAEMVALASSLTIAKSALTTLAFMALLIGLGLRVWRRFSKRAPRLA